MNFVVNLLSLCKYLFKQIKHMIDFISRQNQITFLFYTCTEGDAWIENGKSSVHLAGLVLNLKCVQQDNIAWHVTPPLESC